MIEKFKSTTSFKIANYLGFGFVIVIVLNFLFLTIVQGTWTAWLPAGVFLFLPLIIFWSSLIINFIIIIQGVSQNNNCINRNFGIGYIILMILTILSIFAYPLMGISIKTLFFI